MDQEAELRYVQKDFVFFISDLFYEFLFNEKLQCTHVTKISHASFLIQEKVGPN